MTSASFKRALTQLLLVPVVILAVLTGILALEVNHLQTSAAWVDHTDLVIARSNELTRLMIDEETGLRGYVLTRREEFLEPYNKAKGEIDSRFQELRQLVSDNSSQLERLQKLSLDCAEWGKFAAYRLDARRTQEEIVSDSFSAKARMDQIREEAAEFVQAEEALRAQRSSLALSISRGTFLLMALLAIVGAALIYLYSRRLFHQLATEFQSHVAKVQAQQEWLNTTLRGIGDAVIACNAQGQVVFMNAVADKLTGWTEQEARGHNLAEVFHIVHEETRALVESPVDKVRRLGTIVGLANHTVLIRKDGTEIAIDDSGAPTRDAQGNLIGVVMVFRDVSERRDIDRTLQRTEAESRARAAELEAILQVVPAVTFIAHDPNCALMTSSLYGYQLLGLSPGTNTSQSLVSYERPNDFRIMKNGRELAPYEFPVQVAASTGQQVRNSELTIQFGDGSSRELFGNAAPLFDERGAVRGAVGAFIDITDRKRSEEALRKTEKLAVVGRLAASISHEINNPLEAVTNLLYLVRNATTLGQSQEYARIAEEELGRVSSIATQTLRYYRQSSRPAQVELPKILDSVLSLYGRRLSSAGIEVVCKYESSEPFFGYDGELRQVFINLVANAFDSTRTSGKKMVIRVREAIEWKSGAKGVRVSVADTGHGMDQKTMKRIFEPFFSTRGEVGTGLGLWITKDIIDKHHGSIRVRSSQEPRIHGTVFVTFFPISAPALLKNRIKQKPRPLRQKKAGPSPYRVLSGVSFLPPVCAPSCRRLRVRECGSDRRNLRSG